MSDNHLLLSLAKNYNQLSTINIVYISKIWQAHFGDCDKAS